MMYIASPYGAVHALDATTGVEKWKVELPNNDLPSKRGLAYWPGGDGAPPSIIFGGTSGLLYSLKASDGTREVSGSITKVNSGAQQTGAASSQVLTSARSLATESSRLQAEVAQFLNEVRAA